MYDLSPDRSKANNVNMPIPPVSNNVAPSNTNSVPARPAPVVTGSPIKTVLSGSTDSKTSTSAIPIKTPVSVLQEMYSRKGTTPKYELVQIEGAVHEPTFMYRVMVDDVVATGTGHSKKEAKHAAAKTILERLHYGQNSSNFNIGQTPLNDGSNPVVSPYDDKIPGNPVGQLQEMCMARRKPPPTYEVEHEEGLPHERHFTIACIVGKMRETGTGKSKKQAKRQAAYKMLQTLKDLPADITNPTAGMEDEDEIAQKFAALRYAGLKDSKISSLTHSQSQKVSQFHRTLKASTGEKLNQLQTEEMSELLSNENEDTPLKDAINVVQFLQEIANEQSFEVTYADIEEQTINSQYQCLVQISTFPVAVCHGQGTTRPEAQMDAARNTLEYLKIMTKK